MKRGELTEQDATVCIAKTARTTKMDEHPVYRFVVTGGPCGGKTTAMSELRSYLRENGFRVFIVPEAATMLFINGATPEDLTNEDCQHAFQSFVINTQMQLEESFDRYARSCKQKSVLLCDRGIMDGAAYVSKDMWNEILNNSSMDTISAREGRYNAVFHLVTAANGAADNYSLVNNDARHETVEEAIQADKNTQDAWHGHPHHIVIDNRSGRSFDQKISFLKSVISRYVGLPAERSRSVFKYKLNTPPNIDSFPSHTEVFDVEKVMLSDDGSYDSASPISESSGRVLYSFLRKRSQGSCHAYGMTTVRRLPSGEIIQNKCIISARLYNSLVSARKDPKRHIVKQRRYCFRHDHQSFHVSHWLEPKSAEDMWTLVAQCETEPNIPSYLDTGPELSTTPSHGAEYSFREISLKN